MTSVIPLFLDIKKFMYGDRKMLAVTKGYICLFAEIQLFQVGHGHS